MKGEFQLPLPGHMTFRMSLPTDYPVNETFKAPLIRALKGKDPGHHQSSVGVCHSQKGKKDLPEKRKGW